MDHIIRLYTKIYLKPEIFNNQNKVNFEATIENKFLFLHIHIKHKDVTSKLRISGIRTIVKTKQVSDDTYQTTKMLPGS